MSLAKIPVVLLVSWAFEKSLTPPNPPPPKNERVLTNINEGMRARLVALARKIQYFATFVEIAVIIAFQYPHLGISKVILSTLVLQGGYPGNIKLTTPTSIGAAMIVLGTLLRLATYKHLGQFFTFEASIQKGHQLITTGPYSFVRHPSYTGMLMTHPGWFVWQLSHVHGSWVRESGVWNSLLGKFVVGGYGVVVILGMLYLVLKRMSGEDAALKKKFGKKWEEWARKVPYSVFPGIY